MTSRLFRCEAARALKIESDGRAGLARTWRPSSRETKASGPKAGRLANWLSAERGCAAWGATISRLIWLLLRPSAAKSLDAAAQHLGDLRVVIETERDGHGTVGSTPTLLRHCGIFPLLGRNGYDDQPQPAGIGSDCSHSPI